MNYLLEVNAFERWLETNYLPASSQLLWYKLLMLFNRCGWAEWVTVDNQRLMSLMQISNEKTFIKTRDNLLKAGLIEYQKGTKGSPNRYKLISFNKISTVKNTVNSTVDNTVDSTVNNTVDSTVDNTVDSTVNNTVDSTVDSTVNNTVDSTVNNTVNSTDINKLKLNQKKKRENMIKEKVPKSPYGEFGRVHLTLEEYQKLQNRLGEAKTLEYINKLDEYIASKNKRYSSHYATILSWYRKDNPNIKTCGSGIDNVVNLRKALEEADRLAEEERRQYLGQRND